jgi:hypothetical protein
MATIINVTTQAPAQNAPPEILMPENPNEITLELLLVKLGQKVIQTELRNQLLPMSQIAALCKNYRLRWKYWTAKAKDLEAYSEEYFKHNSEIRCNGVQVEFGPGRNEHQKPALFMRFCKLYPDGSCN